MTRQWKRLSARQMAAYVRSKFAAATEPDRMDGRPGLPRDAAEYAHFEALEELWEELGLFPVELSATAGFDRQPPEPVRELRSSAARSAGGTAAWLGIAAMLLLTVGVLSVQMLDGSRPHSYQTKRGERILINLADDSVVHLNANTRVSIEMTGSQREIRLEKGEGLFNVARDDTRKFIVHTKTGTAEAIGTRFNVQTFGDEFSVTVLEGVVLVSNHAADRSSHVAQYVERGQQVIVGADGLISSADVPDVEAVVSWTNSKLVFNGEALEQVVERINQHSKRRIEIQDARLRSLPVYGIFNAGDTRGFLAALQQSYPVQAITQSHDSTYLVYRKPSAAGGREEERQQ